MLIVDALMNDERPSALGLSLGTFTLANVASIAKAVGCLEVACRVDWVARAINQLTRYLTLILIAQNTM